MKGYLYVEEDLLGKPNKTYIKRYFVSYRFCGLKWFTKEATEIKNAAYLQCISNDTCGWVYGGSILVESVDTEKEMPYKDHAIYPFVVHLRCGEHETSVRLASKSEELRSKWVDEINLSMKIMTFVSACVQNDVLPHPAIFDAVRDNVNDDMTLTEGPLTARHLSAVLNYYSVCSPHGLMLHSFVLENAHVTDALVPYIAAVLQMAPYVGVVSLAQNLLTSAGVGALCDALGSCKYITDINLSGNFLFDACADLLARSLGELTDLRVLNLSHNYFTKAAVRAFTLRLATHRSKLTSVNFSHNALGDGIAVFVSLLCANQPSVLREFDISFCGVGDLGVTELAAALVKCKTLQQGKLHGAYLGASAMQALIKAQADHHVAYQSRRRRPGEAHTGLSLSFGGIAQGCTEALCLSLKSLKTSLMYVADVAHVRGAVFRRRLLYKQPLEHETTADDLVNPLHMLQHELQRLAQEAYPVAHLTVRLPAHLRSGYEVLEELALYLQCDPGQLVLLSCTATVTNTVVTSKTTDQSNPANQGSPPMPSKNGQASAKEASVCVLYSLVFTVLDTPPNRATVRRNNSYMHSFPQVMGTTTQRIVEASVRRTSALGSAATSVVGTGPQGQQGLGPQSGAGPLTSTTGTLFGGAGKAAVSGGGGGRDLPEQALYRAACLRSASEVLVALHDVAAQSHPFLRALGVRRVALKYPNPRFLEAAHEPEYVTFHCVIRGAGTKGGGLSDHYLPVLYPRMLTQAESNANYDASFEDTDDDEVFDTAVRARPTPAPSTATAASASTTGAPGSAVGAMAPVPEEEEDDLDPEYRFVIASEEQMLTSLQLRQRRQVNEKLITAVRQLYAERELSSLQAKFWEGAFGHLKHKHVTQAGLKQALHRETGTFNAVYLRQQLYEAMFHRDLPLMNRLIGELQGRGTAQGGLALVYALRLRSEILGLQRTFQDITELARSYGELSMVEDFLLSCGKLGYSGPEMFQAVELRQELVAQGVKQRRKSVHTDLPLVKHKALISNLLISREMGAIEDKLDELRGSAMSASANAAGANSQNPTPPALELLHVPECVAAEELLQEYEHTLVQVKSAIKTRHPDHLDQALAQAAYGFFYFEEVSRAVNVLNDISNNPAELLRPIVQALRANDISGLDETFERIRKVGWMHPAMDSAVCTKINDRQNKITEDEIIKSKLIKFCLAIKNGFKVNANEMMQLLRRAYKLKLDVDPVMSAYLKTVSKSVKQFAGVLKQEKYIQQLIDSNDITVLAKLLAGRGSGKLVMCCPSTYVQDEWMHYLQNCCDGRYKGALADADSAGKEPEVVYTGTLEKAARNDQGLVRGWRQRFFQLNPTSLSYYTKPRGERKGVIRVIGGGVRRMDPVETGGRPYCIELEEGRDISLIDPDLLAEASKHVLQAKTREFEIAVKKGIALKSLDLLTRMLRFAEESEIVLDYGLVNEARACITSLKEKNLKRDLRFAAKLVPRSQLDELIALAEKLSLDPNIPSYRTVLALAAKSEVEQHMIRARGALEVHDEALFARAFFAISRFDLSLLTTRQRCQLAALILQHSGYHALARSTRGAPLSGVTHLTKHALSCCLQLMVETEPMDLSRLLVALAYRVVTVERNSSYVSHAFFPVADLRGDKAASIAVYLDDMDLGHSSNAQYDITKYKQLRISSVYRYKGLGITAALQKGKRKKGDRTTDIMRFSTVPLLKSLLKYDPSTAVNARLHLEAFNVLLAVMGDRPISSLSRPAKGTVLQTRNMSLGSLVLDLVDAAVNRYPIMCNELYFQLAKQLTDNPNKRSWVRGWLLMTIYMHSFLPSADAVPYLKNFVDTSVRAAADELALVLRMLQTADATVQSGLAPSPAKPTTSQMAPSAPPLGQLSPAGAAGVSEEDISALKYCSKIMTYCSALVSRIETIVHNQKAARHDTTSAPVLYKPVVASTSATHARENSNELAPNLSAPLVERAYEQKGLDFEIALMTGSVVKFSLPYGQCSTPFSVLLYLYDKLLPEDAYFERSDYSFQQSEEALTGAGETATGDSVAAMTSGATSSYLSPEMKVHRVLSMFRGFALYSLQESEYNDERSDIDLHRLPVQPDQTQCLDWTKDLQWDLLQLHTSEEQGTEVDLSVGAFAFSNTLLLRRRTSMLHEEFADEFELFQDQVSDRDVTALHELWTRWLSAEGFATLPHDHVRVDLLYAEDTRYVNSRLYPLSEESFTYLLAMQLALCWVDGEATEWAEIDEEVMANCSISVRPCYKFPPQHLIDAPLASSPRRAVTAAEALEQYAADAHADAAANGAQHGGRDGNAPGDETEDSSDEDYEERRSEYSASTGTSSEYVSTAPSEAPTPEPIVLTPLTDASAVSESDLELLQRLVALVGVAPDTVQMDRLVQRILQFHAIALNANIPVSSPKYRYLMKRAYIHYLSSASSFYGNHFAEAVHVPEPNHSTSKHRAEVKAGHFRTAEGKQGKKGKKQGRGKRGGDSDEDSDSHDAGREPSDVLVAVSVGALTLLDPETWDVRFTCPIWDIQDFSVIISESGRQLLVFNINGMDLALEGDKVHEILDTVDGCCREALGRGYFPYGSDASCVTLETQALAQQAAQAADGPGADWDEDSVLHLTNSKKIFKTFLHTFPLLPRPPIPDVAARAAEGFIPTPKSQRDLFAKERAEEERVEHEISRAAAEAQLERNQRQIQQGRENMKKYQTANKTAEEGEGSDVSDAEEGTATRRQSALSRSRRKNNRSVFGDFNTTEELRAQIQQERISSLACGVSARANSKFADFKIPVPPTRVGGTVKLVTSNDKKRTLRRPVILESRGLDEVLERGQVRSSLNADAAPLLAPSASAAPGALSGGGLKGKKGSFTATFADPLERASEATLLAWSNDRLQSALLEQFTAVTMRFHQHTEHVQEQWHRSAELLESNTSATQAFADAQQESPDPTQQGDNPDYAAEAGEENPRPAEVALPQPSGRDPYLYGINHYLRRKKRPQGTAANGHKSPTH